MRRAGPYTAETVRRHNQASSIADSPWQTGQWETEEYMRKNGARRPGRRSKLMPIIEWGGGFLCKPYVPRRNDWMLYVCVCVCVCVCVRATRTAALTFRLLRQSRTVLVAIYPFFRFKRVNSKRKYLREICYVILSDLLLFRYRLKWDKFKSHYTKMYISNIFPPSVSGTYKLPSLEKENMTFFDNFSTYAKTMSCFSKTVQNLTHKTIQYVVYRPLLMTECFPLIPPAEFLLATNVFL